MRAENSMRFEISELERRDIDAATKLYIEVFAQQPWCENNKYDDIRHYIERLNQMNTNHCYLYKMDGQIIGVGNIILETNKDTSAEYFYLKQDFFPETNTRTLRLVCAVE